MAVAVAILCRVAAMVLLVTYQFPAGHNHFAFGYETGAIARSLALGEGFASPFGGHTGPTAWISPLYPAMCAGIFKGLGVYSTASAVAILTINSLFSGLVCIPLWRLGERVAGKRCAAWSAWIWAVVPFFWMWPITWVWETGLSALLTTWAVLLTLRLREQQSARKWTWFGLFWGTVALSNPSLLSVLPLCGLYAIWPGWRTQWRNAVLAAVVFSAVISPWLARNQMVFGHFVFLRGNFPFEFRLGNFHNSTGMGWNGLHPAVNPAQFERYARLGEYEFVRQSGYEAKAFVKEHPSEFLKLCGSRFLSFWDGRSLEFNPAKGYAPWMILLTSALAAFGWLFMMRAQLPGAGLLGAVVLLYPLPYYITYPMVRYRHAVEPILVLMMVWLAAELARAVKSRAMKDPGSDEISGAAWS